MSEKKRERRLPDGHEITNAYIKTIGYYFPHLFDWVGQIADPRNPNLITFPKIHMFLMGLMLFFGRLETRRQLTFSLNTSQFASNFNALCRVTLDRIAHHDTVNYFYSRLAPDELKGISRKMLNKLIRKRSLEKFRFMGSHYLVAIDGTQLMTFKKRHCDHCLTAKSENGEIRYYHNAVEAKLVTGTGLCFSMGTEFVENDNPEQTVQDCELKACYRLLDRLKKDFPQLAICLLMDSLYAIEPIIRIADDNNWKFMINYKEGCARTIADEARSIFLDTPENTLKYRDDKKEQHYRWSCFLEYKGHRIHHIRCEETANEKETVFEWITNIIPEKNNVADLCNNGGRYRWKIENEGFNIQKNGGYNLEHSFSTDNTASKNYYILMQIAHMINQLVEHGSLLKADSFFVYGSCWNIQKRLVEELKYIAYKALEPEEMRGFYIKLDTG